MSYLDRTYYTKEKALGEWNLNKETGPGCYDIPQTIGSVQNLKKNKKILMNTYNNTTQSYFTKKKVITDLYNNVTNSYKLNDYNLEMLKDNNKVRKKNNRKIKATSFFDGSGLLCKTVDLKSKQFQKNYEQIIDGPRDPLTVFFAFFKYIYIKKIHSI